jgi:hypothetical protein
MLHYYIRKKEIKDRKPIICNSVGKKIIFNELNKVQFLTFLRLVVEE